MRLSATACALCSKSLPKELWNLDQEARCPYCRQAIMAAVFPAIGHTQVGEAPAALQGESEASCFYHPQSRATRVCEDCGRFLCALCDLEVDGRHICPRCFNTPKNTVEPRRVMYDSVALAMSTLPALLFWPALIGAPWSLFIVLRRWNAPGSMVPRTKIRFILAALFALTEIGFVVFFIYILTQVSLKGPRR
jgi:hypothetical protein